jgi:signal transduction histidine kinase
MSVGILLWAITLVVVIQGIFVLFQSEPFIRRLFFVATTALGAIWTIGLFIFLVGDNVNQLTLATKIYYAAAAGLPWAMLAFAGYATHKHWRHSITILTAIPFLVVASWVIFWNSSLITSVTVGAPNTAELNTSNYMWYVAYCVVYSLIAIGILVSGFFKASSKLERSRVAYILLAYVLSLSFGELFNLILPYWGNYNLIWAGPIGVLIFNVIIYFAISRYRLFDIGFYAARILLLSTIAIVTSFLYVVLTFAIMTPDDLGNIPLITTNVAATAVFFGIAYLITRILIRSSNRWTKRGLVDDGILDSVFRAALSSDNTHQVILNIARAVNTYIKRRSVVTAVIGDDDNLTLAHTKSSNTISREILKKIDVAMSKQNLHTLITEEIESDNPIYELLRIHSVSIIVRNHLVDNRRLNTATTYLIICSDEQVLYSDNEIKMLHAVCGVIALALENTIYYERIQNFNQELKVRVANATTNLRETNRKLKKLDATKDDFIAMASHQLRTPLTSIKGYAAMLLDGDFGHLSIEQKKVLSEVYTSSERMAFLISDFLDVSRLQAGRFELQKTPTRLDEVLSSEVHQLRISAEMHQIKLEYEPPPSFPEIYCDRDKIRQVMMNMIDNAIFYSHAGNKVGISLYQQREQIIFSVRDQGIGVPHNEQHKLFTKFYRASNARQARPDGTGVGLYIARKVVAAHDGAIIFESRENEGSTFGFRLPIKLADN